jgi:hypothetical protein
MMNGIKKNNNGNTASSSHTVDNKSGVWSHRNRSKTAITANKKDRTADITARNTDLAFYREYKG